MIAKSILQRARRTVNQLLGRDVRVPLQHRCRTELLGVGYGGWCICPDRITAESIVYSFGVGEDISFDLAIIKRFDVHVHAFDPTPKSIRWINQQNLPPQFHFHELGLADYDGVATFALPRPDFVSYALSQETPDGQRVIQAQVNRLKTIAQKLGHRRIDILKMDIEGAEYRVIDDLENVGLPIGQLLVEFHHQIGNAAAVNQTRRAIATLNELGFRLFHNSKSGKEFSFINLSA